MHHAVGTVGAVKGSSWPEDDLNPFQIRPAGGDEVEGVQPQGRDVGDAVVRQDEHGAREDVVESANHDVALYQTRLGKVDSRLIADVFGDRQHSASLDFIAFKHGHGCRCIEDLLL